MTTDQPQPDDPFDEEVASLLRRATSAPEPRGEFIQLLGERLDAQFAARLRPATLVQTLVSPALNGHGAAWNGAAVNGHAGKQLAALEKRSTCAVKRSAWRRRMMFVGAAAALLAVMVVWGPAYGWTAAVRQWVVSVVPFVQLHPASPGARLDVPAGGAGLPQVASVKQVQPANTPAAPAQFRTFDVPAATENGAGTAVRAVSPERETIIVATAPKDRPAEPAAGYASAEPARQKKVAPPWEPLAEPLPLEKLSQCVDDDLAAMWQSNGIHPAEPASDVEFMRRVYLDLTGRIPSVSEVHAFLDSRSPQRREQLVERLLTHRDHATHLAAVWRRMLLPDGVDLTSLRRHGLVRRVAHRAVRRQRALRSDRPRPARSGGARIRGRPAVVLFVAEAES